MWNQANIQPKLVFEKFTENHRSVVRVDSQTADQRSIYISNKNAIYVFDFGSEKFKKKIEFKQNIVDFHLYKDGYVCLFQDRVLVHAANGRMKFLNKKVSHVMVVNSDTILSTVRDTLFIENAFGIHSKRLGESLGHRILEMQFYKTTNEVFLECDNGNIYVVDIQSEVLKTTCMRKDPSVLLFGNKTFYTGYSYGTVNCKISDNYIETLQFKDDIVKMREIDNGTVLMVDEKNQIFVYDSMRLEKLFQFHPQIDYINNIQMDGNYLIIQNPDQVVIYKA